MMATMARAIPPNVAAASRSPSATETKTGITTAHTAVVGATTAITPIASARYRSATPPPPQTPASAPHRKSVRAGAVVGKSGRIDSRISSPASWETTTTARVLALFAVTPPMKSAAP